MKEIWKDIDGYNGEYQISSIGRIKSFKSGKERILKPAIDSKNGKGYYCICLNKKFFRVHQLVAMAFLNHKPNGHSIVIDHINGVKCDNRVENLRLVSHRDNMSTDKCVVNYKNKTSNYTGVVFSISKLCYTSSIKFKNKSYSLGCFKTEIEAHNAYQEALFEINNNTFYEYLKNKKIPYKKKQKK